jgi:hypothetical protein
MHFTKDDKTIIYETGWRSGEFYYETEDDTQPEIVNGDNLFDTEYELTDWSTDDGCWDDYEYDGFTEEEQEKIEEWFQENSVFDLEEQGWINVDSEMVMTCDPIIEKSE